MTISELEAYFKTATLPQTIQLTPIMSVTDVPKFVDSHLATLQQNSASKAYQGFYDRLILLHSLLTDTTPLRKD